MEIKHGKINVDQMQEIAILLHIRHTVYYLGLIIIKKLLLIVHQEL